MEINEKHKSRIEELINEKKCPKDFECYRSGFENLCKAKDIGLKGVVECLEEDPHKCKFSICFGYSWFCSCAIRVYAAKELGK